MPDNQPAPMAGFLLPQMTVYKIPLRPQNQTLQVSMAGVLYGLAITWRDPYGWFMDIRDASGTLLVSGLPLTPGVDLLAPYPHHNFNVQMKVLSDYQSGKQYPTFTDLGKASNLYYLSVKD